MNLRSISSHFPKLALLVAPALLATWRKDLSFGPDVEIGKALSRVFGDSVQFVENQIFAFNPKLTFAGPSF